MNTVKFELVLESVAGLAKSTGVSLACCLWHLTKSCSVQLFFLTYSLASRLGSKKVAGETKKVLLGPDGASLDLFFCGA
jgi:hypothetical protein